MRHGFKQDRHRLFPPILHVENTNICNIRCIHCPQADPFTLVPGYRPQSMPLDIFERVIREAAQYPCAIRMTPDGETLLPKEFPDMLDLIIRHQAYLFAFNTNGLLLEGHILECLLSPGQVRIAVEISLDALYPESYARIRVGSNYARVLKNIFTLLAERDRLGLRDRIKVLVSIINQPELAEGEYDQFIRFWEPLVDKVIRRSYVDTKAIMPQKFAPEVADGATCQAVSAASGSGRWPCVVPFTRLVVTYDGTVRFCPDDWRKETTLASVRDTTLAEIWQSEVFASLRRSHLDASISHPTCLACTDWQVIRWDYDYISALNDLFGEGTL